jgi:hypothetical protein
MTSVAAIAAETLMNNPGLLFSATAPFQNRNHGHNQTGLDQQQQCLSRSGMTEG